MSEERNKSTCKTFSRLAHVSIVVKDIMESVLFYESLGIGPFENPEHHSFAVTAFRGVSLDSKLIIKETSIGALKLQLVQHLRGDHIVKEFIDRRGYGVYHLGFLVENIDEHEKDMRKRGVDVIQKGRREDGTGYSYFDTESKAGIILEIKEYPQNR
jgi:methylmalonyl-CoA/ethylmalonyl-CoA epimerase